MNQAPWWAAILLPSLPALGVFILQLALHFRGGKTERLDRAERAQAAGDAALLRERELVSAGVTSMVSNLREDIDASRARNAELVREAAHAWTVAHRWCGLAWLLIGHARQARQIAESYAKKCGDPPLTWQEALPDLPDFEGARSGSPAYAPAPSGR